MKTNKGKVYGANGFTVSTYRIHTSIHDQAVTYGINVGAALEEILTIKIQAMGGNALEGLEDELKRKREEDTLLHVSMEALEKRIVEMKAGIAALVNDREISTTLMLGPAYLLRKLLQDTRWAIMPVLEKIQPNELEPGMKIVQTSEKYIIVETSNLKIMPDPSMLKEKVGCSFDVEKVKSDIFAHSAFNGYIEDFKQRYMVGEWKLYDEKRHRKIRDEVMREIHGLIDPQQAKESIEKPWTGE